MIPQSFNTATRGPLYFFLCLLISAIFMVRLFSVVDDQLQAPFDLVYESPNLSTIKLIQAGVNPYSPDTYAQLPFVLTMYTPFYHYVTAHFPVFADNPFFCGRMVSMLAMFVASFGLFFVNRQNGVRLLPAVALSLFFSFRPVISNTAFLKNDPLALCFSVFAVILLHNGRSTGRLAFSAFLCVCAVATKQSYIAASLACLLYLLLADRQRFRVFLLFWTGFSILFMVTAMYKWGGGFWFSTVTALGQDIVWAQALFLAQKMLQQPLFCFLTGLTLACLTVVFTQNPRQAFTESPYLIYLLVSAGLLLVTLGKIGASTNYFFEFLLAQLMWIVFVFRRIAFRDCEGATGLLIVGAFVVCSLLELQTADRTAYSFVTQDKIATVRAYYRQMNRQIDSLGFTAPRILNPFSHIHAYSISDTIYLNDPFLYRNLWEKGILDVQPMVASIHKEFFDIIMIPSHTKKIEGMAPPHQAIVREVIRRYRIGARGGGYCFYIRADHTADS